MMVNTNRAIKEESQKTNALKIVSEKKEDVDRMRDLTPETDVVKRSLEKRVSATTRKRKSSLVD